MTYPSSSISFRWTWIQSRSWGWGEHWLKIPWNFCSPTSLRKTKERKTKCTWKHQGLQMGQDQEDNSIYSGDPKRDLRMPDHQTNKTSVGTSYSHSKTPEFPSLHLWSPCLQPHCIPFPESHSLRHLLPLSDSLMSTNPTCFPQSSFNSQDCLLIGSSVDGAGEGAGGRLWREASGAPEGKVCGVC